MPDPTPQSALTNPHSGMSDSTPQSAISTPQSDIETLYALASLATTASDARSAQSSILATIMAAFPADSGSLSLLSPESGRLACGTSGIGRMAEPTDILEALAALLK